MTAEMVVIALGGNAIQQSGQDGTHEKQLENVYKACKEVYQIIKAGYKVVLTSGNGPQVGAIKLQNEAAASQSPEMPLYCCGAMSQGLIGYWMQQAMGNVLRCNGEKANVVTCITQAVVDSNDPSFQNPTKPVGRFYTMEEAKAKQAANQQLIMREQPGRGWRVVVPSPRPLSIVEYEVILQLVRAGTLVICTNGGGIPVVSHNGELSGIDCVIDKDLASSLLATQLGAGCLLILTDVTHACLDYGKPEQRELREITLAQALELEAQGHFGSGSMGPKVRAAIEFVQKTGRHAIITSLDKAMDALQGKCGTRVVAE